MSRPAVFKSLPSGAAPCFVCGGEGGKPHYTNPHVPARWSLGKFGLAGIGCIRCWGNLYAADRRGEPDPLAHARAIASGTRVACVAYGRTTAARRVDPKAVRRAALAIHSKVAMLGDLIESRRIAATERGPELSPKAGATRARREYRATIFGQSRGAGHASQSIG